MPLIRQSKVKHVFGKASKRENCFDGIRITKNSWDSTFCSVSAKFLAVVTESAGGGSFLVVSLDKPGRIEPDAMPLVNGHKAAVLDLQWSPHDDTVIASASEDCTVKVWRIPEDGIPAKATLVDPVFDLVAHQRRVGLVVWHPTVQNLLLSAGADNMAFLWDCEKEEILTEMSFPDMIIAASFSFNGAKLITSCKDKITRVINPRTGENLLQLQCHEGSKPQQVTFLHGDEFLTTGFSRMSERQIALWDMADSLKPKAVFDLDTTNGTLFPFFDRDLNLVYLCGKGDSVIRYFEIASDGDFLYPIGQFTSSVAQRGFGWLPKRAVNTALNEVARCFRLHQNGFCEVIPFVIPRKSELFQDDLYPDVVSDQPALSLEEWMSGVDKDPIMISMRPNSALRAKPKRAVSEIKSSSGCMKTSKPAETASVVNNVKNTFSSKQKMPPTSEESDKLGAILEEIASIRITLSQLTARVAKLESQHLKINEVNSSPLPLLTSLESEDHRVDPTPDDLTV